MVYTCALKYICGKAFEPEVIPYTFGPFGVVGCKTHGRSWVPSILRPRTDRATMLTTTPTKRSNFKSSQRS